MMKSRILLLLLFPLTLSSFSASAQADSLPLRKIYVLRPGQYVGALVKIRIDINGKTISLPNDTYAFLECRADSVVLKVANSRVSGESVHPLVTFKEVSYFVTLPEKHAHKKDRLILTEVDKESYDKYASKVSRQVPTDAAGQ
jgi:hypothetical protein